MTAQHSFLPRTRNHAEVVGHGVHKQQVVPPAAVDSSGEDSAATMLPAADEKTVWSTTPTVVDQLLRGPEYWKLDRVEVKIFNLGVSEELASYNQLLTQSSLPGSSTVVVSNERQWNSNAGSWSACVEVQHVLYRQLLKPGNKNAN